MGITKLEGFDEKLIEIAELLKAVGHPARLTIIEYLADKTECVGNDIVDTIPLAQPTISRHLSELKKVGLVQGTVSGKHMNYCINHETWSRLKEYLQKINVQSDCSASDCC